MSKEKQTSKNYKNLSNEFVEAKLNDDVKYKIYIKDLNAGMSELADRFIRKERIIKEKSSIGGFRIPQESLKKRLNPNIHDTNQHDLYSNPAFNSFSFNPNKKPLNISKNLNQIDLSESLIDESLPYDANKELAGNLIDRLDLEINKLKKESQEYIKYLDSVNNSKQNIKQNQQEEFKEKKVINQYLHYDPSRVQTLKHVTTQMKPEYISLDDLQKMKEEHQKKMLEIENEYYQRKRRDQEDVNKFLKYSDKNVRYFNEMESKVNESKKITPEEIGAILKHEEDYLNQNKVKKIEMKRRARSARGIRRTGVSENQMSKEEERYVKKYMNYKMKRKIQEGTDNPVENQGEDWNTTKIKSHNVNGIVNRPDGLPGHIDREEYSLYYMSISSNTPKSLSIKSAAASRSKSRKSIKSRKSRSKSINTRMGVKSKNKRDSSLEVNIPTVNQKMNSHLAFTKLIFNLLDKNKNGSIPKQIISQEINLDEKILFDLGFDSHEEFLNSLMQFPTVDDNYMKEQELIAFFLSRSELAEDYLDNYRMNMEEGNMQQENNFEFNLYGDNFENENLDEEEKNPNNKMDFLNYESTEERLEKLRDSLNIKNKNSNVKEYNKHLTNKLKSKIIPTNTNSKVNISYRDYSNFLRKYRSTADLNFTIPKPFDFLKRDYTSKKLQKIQEILEERKKKEDDILNQKFKPNQLKREIFISQYANVIEAERERRKYRTEKLKEKIVQEMRPFSFYENDERRHKEKLARVCEPPQFAPFKANVIPWTSQVNMYEDILKKMEDQRKARIEERKMSLYQTAKLPPRMEMHEKKKIQQENEMKLVENNISKLQRSKSFKANKVPNFTKAHETFYRNLEKKKSAAKLTKPEPFNFNEPKKKATLREYLDKENDPKAKNPQFKRNIVEIIQKISQKPKIEPASTKSLNLLMEKRRKELEEKQRKEEEKLLDEKLRKEKQERLKERVVNSRQLVDNSKTIQENRKKQQEEFKRGLIEKKQKYEQDLARTLQRVYNKPLMFEMSSKVEKFTMNRNMKEKIDSYLENERSDGENYNDNQNINEKNTESNMKYNNSNNREVEEIYEEKFDDI